MLIYMNLININTNKKNSIVKLFIPNIFEQEGGKKGGKKGKKGKKAKKKKKKGEAGEKPEAPEKEEWEKPEKRERPEREEGGRPEREEGGRPEREEGGRRDRGDSNRSTSESSYDSDTSSRGSPMGSPMGYSGGINSQIITSAVVPSNLQVDIDNQRENNTRQDAELTQLRDLIFNEKSEQVKLLKEKEYDSRKEEMDKILNEIERLKSVVNKNHLDGIVPSSNIVPTEPTPVPVDQKAGTLTISNLYSQNDKSKKYVIKYN